jgi:hypothetical protein
MLMPHCQILLSVYAYQPLLVRAMPSKWCAQRYPILLPDALTCCICRALGGTGRGNAFCFLTPCVIIVRAVMRLDASHEI